MSKIARIYQTEAFDAIRQAFRDGKKKIIAELCTGSGKGTIVALVCKMARDKGKRVLAIVNRDVLVTQLLNDIQGAGVHCYREQAKDRAPITADCVVGSVQSMQGKWIEKWRENYFDIVITDEVHFSTAKTFKKILDRFPNSYHIGLTATAERHDKKALWKGYEEIVYRFPLKIRLQMEKEISRTKKATSFSRNRDTCRDYSLRHQLQCEALKDWLFSPAAKLQKPAPQQCETME
jgi:superfamily II DNA or RNA helicase